MQKLYQDQNENVSAFLTQCKRWHQDGLNDQQQRWVAAIERDIKALEKVNNQILFLVDHYQHGTIDKILAKDDVELALDVLSGKIDPP